MLPANLGRLLTAAPNITDRKGWEETEFCMGKKENSRRSEVARFAIKAAEYSSTLGPASLAATCGIFALAAMAVWGVSLDSIITVGITVVILVVAFLGYDIACVILQQRNAQSALNAVEQRGARMKQRYRSRSTKSRKTPQARAGRSKPLPSVDEIDTVQDDTSSHLEGTSDPRRSK